MKKQDFKVLKTKDLYPFPDNPFHVAEDETLSELAESIKEFGIVTPIITRPKEDGDGYEVIAGQRRVRASELAGINTVPAFVLPLDRDRAIITLVDSNLQRENILPSEKAFAYKMKLEALKHQGKTSVQVEQKLSRTIVAESCGVSDAQIQRYIRLTELVPDLQKMVDEKKLAFTPAVEISFIRPKNQRYIAVSIEGQQSSPSLSQAQKMRELDKDGKLNGDVIDGILSQEKKEVDKVIINSAELEKYFGKDKSPREMKDKIISLLDDWKAKQPPELGKPEKKADLGK